MQTPQYMPTQQTPPFLFSQYAAPNLIQPFQQPPSSAPFAQPLQPQPLQPLQPQPLQHLQPQPLQSLSQQQPVLVPLSLPSTTPGTASFLLSSQISPVSSNLTSLSQPKPQTAALPSSTPASVFSPAYAQPQMLQAQQTLQQQQIIMQQVAKISERVEEVLGELKKLDTRISSLETVNSQLLTYSKHQTVKLSQQEDDHGSAQKLQSSKSSVSKNAQTSFEAYRSPPPSVKQIDADAALARELQEKFNNETPAPAPSTPSPAMFSSLPPPSHAPSPYYSSLYSSSSVIPPSSSSSTLKSHTCPLCPERFATSELLELHVNSHFDEEPPKSTPKDKEEGFLAKFFGGPKKETKTPEPDRKRPASVSLPPTTYPTPYYPGAPYAVQAYPYPQTPMYYYPPDSRPK